jgi:hypothetical protein
MDNPRAWNPNAYSPQLGDREIRSEEVCDSFYVIARNHISARGIFTIKYMEFPPCMLPQIVTGKFSGSYTAV